MPLCVTCFGLGYCKKLFSRLVSDRELENPHFRDDVRQFARSLDVPAAEWRDYLLDLYCHYPGRIVDQNGAETFLNMEEFEVPHVREWCRDWINGVPSASGPSRLRSESRERIRALASILRAAFPEEAFTWGLRAANDNKPPQHKGTN